MTDKILKFSGHQLIIEGDTPFTITSFDKIHDSETEHFDIVNSETEKETLSIKKVEKNIIENRFISLYFNYGEKYPYSRTVATVIGENLKEFSNPRPPEQIELNDQLFVLIDVFTQRIWLSNQRQRNTVHEWMREKISAEMTIKSIIRESEFIEKIKTVDKISFAIVPDLFNSVSQDTLSHHLVRDIYGFGASRARIELTYENSRVSDKIKKKFNELIGRRGEFQDITVIGRSDEGLDSVFNMDEVISKISINVPSDDESRLFNPDEVFNTLISSIKAL